MSQRDVFLSGEADNYFGRNQDVLSRKDPIDYVLQDISGRVLDVGASRGDRLNKYVAGREGWGIDPSTKAVAEGEKLYPSLHLSVGTADRLPYESSFFDVVILNFVFHWIDRSALLQSVAEIDRVLAPNGRLAIADFNPDVPYKSRYHHRSDVEVYTFKQQYWDIFTASGIYTKVKEINYEYADIETLLPLEKKSPDTCGSVLLQKIV